MRCYVCCENINNIKPDGSCGLFNSNKCYDDDIGLLQECKENEVCYYYRLSVMGRKTIRRRCARRENHKMNNCGTDGNWVSKEV